MQTTFGKFRVLWWAGQGESAWPRIKWFLRGQLFERIRCIIGYFLCVILKVDYLFRNEIYFWFELLHLATVAHVHLYHRVQRWSAGPAGRFNCVALLCVVRSNSKDREVSVCFDNLSNLHLTRICTIPTGCLTLFTAGITSHTCSLE